MALNSGAALFGSARAVSTPPALLLGVSRGIGCDKAKRGAEPHASSVNVSVEASYFTLRFSASPATPSANSASAVGSGSAEMLLVYSTL